MNSKRVEFFSCFEPESGFEIINWLDLEVRAKSQIKKTEPSNLIRKSKSRVGVGDEKTLNLGVGFGSLSRIVFLAGLCYRSQSRELESKKMTF